MQAPDDRPTARRGRLKKQPVKVVEAPSKGAKAPAKAAGGVAKAPAKASRNGVPAKAAKTLSKAEGSAKTAGKRAKSAAKAPAKAPGKSPANGTAELVATPASAKAPSAGEAPGRAAKTPARVPVGSPPKAPYREAEAARGTDGPRPSVIGRPPRGLPFPTRADRLALTIRRLRRATAVLLVLGVCGFLIDGASRPANPRLVPASDPTAAKGSPAYGTATLSVNLHKGAPACVLEAVTPHQQEFGLMGRTSVAPYAGMAFIFGSPSMERFWMKGTVMALSIAWFDRDGGFVGEASMPPCPPQTAACPTYGPDRPYWLAVEVPAGRLKSLGIGPGSVAQLGGPCGAS